MAAWVMLLFFLYYIPFKDGIIVKIPRGRHAIMKKAARIFIVFAFVSALIITGCTTAANSNAALDTRIYQGVSVRSINVGGMTKEEAKKSVQDVLDKEIDLMELRFSYNDWSQALSGRELNAGYNVDEAVETAYDYGKTGNIIKRMLNMRTLQKSGYDIPLTFKADMGVAVDYIGTIAGQLNRTTADSKFWYTGNGVFAVSPEVNGVKVDEAQLKTLIEASVRPEGGFNAIEVPAAVETAIVTTEKWSGIKEKISGFTTSFNSGDVARSGNIKLAADTINGTILWPGEVFSMNQAVGPRTEEKGYGEAKIIVNGELVPGLAGGICQATTTVYNAALLANLAIVERHPHSLKVGYIEGSRDATISGSTLDLKFRNTTSAPIYIEAFTKTGTMTVNLYGTNDHPGQTVQIVSEVLYRISASTEYIYDSSLRSGAEIWKTKPSSGTKSRAYRQVYENGALISSELLSTDTYQPQTGKLRIGTGQ
jgi:vancomycin resistance protein YoaR